MSRNKAPWGVNRHWVHIKNNGDQYIRTGYSLLWRLRYKCASMRTTLTGLRVPVTVSLGLPATTAREGLEASGKLAHSFRRYFSSDVSQRHPLAPSAAPRELPSLRHCFQKRCLLRKGIRYPTSIPLYLQPPEGLIFFQEVRSSPHRKST